MHPPVGPAWLVWLRRGRAGRKRPDPLSVVREGGPGLWAVGEDGPGPRVAREDGPGLREDGPGLRGEGHDLREDGPDLSGVIVD